MSTSTTQLQQVLTPNNIEDLLLAALPILSGPTGTALVNLAGLVPGVSGFVLAVIIASLAKSAIGISQNQKSYEDWLNFLITFVGLVAAGLAGSGQNTIAEVGVALGFVAKSLPMFQQGLNIEDAGLFVGSLLALLGAALPGSQGVAATNAGLIMATVFKAWPSIASNGKSGLPSPTSAPTQPPSTSGA